MEDVVVQGAGEASANESFEKQSQGVLLVWSGACLGLVLGASLTILLLNRYSVLWTCSGLMLLFLIPMMWSMCRKDQDAADAKRSLARKFDQIWVISFWCICSLVLLLIAKM